MTTTIDAPDPTFPYKSAVAFGTAVKQFLVTAAATTTYGINELRRQFAYDRLLTRVFDHEPDRWVLKGGGGLLARLPGQARHSMDLDLFYRGERTAALDSLATIAAIDIGDFFTFDVVASPTPTAGHSQQLAIRAYLGNTEFQRFKIDLVIASNMTQEPETVEPLVPLAIPGLHSQPYRVYSVVDHIADKHAAMLDMYNDRPSSRYRDLVDLVILANSQRPTAAKLHVAMFSEYTHRNLTPPTTVTLPSEAWIAGYAAQAAAVPGLEQRSADEALVVVRAFLDPILWGRIAGVWNPIAHGWTTSRAGCLRT
jgi:predicted nucleotidyltransferase component of viral defense system